MPTEARRAHTRSSLWLQRSPLVLGLVLLLMVAGPRAARAQEPTPGFLIAPYLLDVTTDAATVAFRLREPMPATLLVTAGSETVRVAVTEPRRAHFLRATGLSAGRTYPYQVVAGDGAVRTDPGDPSFELRTAGLPGDTFTFAVYGDPRPGETGTNRHHRLVLEQLKQTEPLFTLVLGDMVDDGSDPRGWEAFFAVEASLRRRSAIYPVLGDNDVAEGRGLASDYFPMFAQGRYRFAWGGVHFFALHAWGTLGSQPSRELDADAEQLAWLRDELSREEVRQAPFRILFLHDPIYVSRGRSSELLRRYLAPLVSEGGVDVVFASCHLYERSRHDSTHYIVSGGAGAELLWPDPNPAFPSVAEANRHHFCRVDVEPGALQLRAIAEDGTVLDSLTVLPRGSDGVGSESSLRLRSEQIARVLHAGPAAQGPALDVHLFSSSCPYCQRLLARELPRWAEAAHVALRVHYYDLAVPGAYDLFIAAGADFGRQDAELPALFIGRTVLGGEDELSAGVPHELERFRADPDGYLAGALRPFERRHDTSKMRAERFATLRLSVVLGAGLIDGVNPCAFTTVLFLLSYLGVTGGSRRRLLTVGAAFTLAVFLTYLAIGVLFFELASTLLELRALATAVKVVLVAILAVLATLSVRDAIRCLQGKPSQMALKLPAWLQAQIRSRIRAFARERLAGVAGAFALGVVIAGLELACTGQVYLPIVTMLAEPSQRATATAHLVAYNLAFIAPLAAVFLLATFGLGSARLAQVARRHLAASKLALALLFATLGAVVVAQAGWLG